MQAADASKNGGSRPRKMTSKPLISPENPDPLRPAVPVRLTHPDVTAAPVEVIEIGTFTIDAARTKRH